jgi:hypothetical protein
MAPLALLAARASALARGASDRPLNIVKWQVGPGAGLPNAMEGCGKDPVMFSDYILEHIAQGEQGSCV